MPSGLPGWWTWLQASITTRSTRPCLQAGLVG